MSKEETIGGQSLRMWHLEQIDGAYRTMLYRALLAAAKGEKELEDRCYQEMDE